MFSNRTILRFAFVIGIVVTTPIMGLACGFNWYPPSGYFECCDDSGYVVLTEKLLT